MGQYVMLVQLMENLVSVNHANLLLPPTSARETRQDAICYYHLSSVAEIRKPAVHNKICLSNGRCHGALC